jgi:hypothetical protein
MDGPGVGDSVGCKSSTNLQSVPAKHTLPIVANGKVFRIKITLLIPHITILQKDALTIWAIRITSTRTPMRTISTMSNGVIPITPTPIRPHGTITIQSWRFTAIFFIVTSSTIATATTNNHIHIITPRQKRITSFAILTLGTITTCAMSLGTAVISRIVPTVAAKSLMLRILLVKQDAIALGSIAQGVGPADAGITFVVCAIGTWLAILTIGGGVGPVAAAEVVG